MIDHVDVFYWPDGTWCYECELSGLLISRSDDYQLLQVLPDTLADQIDADVDLRNRL